MFKILIALILVTGCSSLVEWRDQRIQHRTEAYIQALSTKWVGQKEDDLYTVRGYPTSLIEKDMRVKIASYHKQHMSVYSTSSGQVDSQTFTCDTWFEIDKDTKLVMHVSAQGNGCKP